MPAIRIVIESLDLLHFHKLEAGLASLGLVFNGTQKSGKVLVVDPKVGNYYYSTLYTASWLKTKATFQVYEIKMDDCL